MTGTRHVHTRDHLARSSGSHAFRIRRAGARDCAALREIERDAFPTQWPPTRFQKELTRPHVTYLAAVHDEPLSNGHEPPGHGAYGPRTLNHASDGLWRKMVRNLRQIAFSEHPALAARSRDYIAGFVGLWFILNEAHIVAIGVRSRRRRRGIGELLLIGALQEAQRRGARAATLEVRTSNEPARRLYRKYGFREVGLRRKYYMDNGEDAVIMTTPPITTREYLDSLRSLISSHSSKWGRSGPATARAASLRIPQETT